MPLTERIVTWAGRRPQAPAFTVGERTVTYGELAARAAGVAAGLRAATGSSARSDLTSTSLLALGVGNTPEFAELFAGATAGDGACAVLDPAWPREQVREVLLRLRPDLVAAEAGSAVAAAARECGIPLLVTPAPCAAGDGEDAPEGGEAGGGPAGPERGEIGAGPADPERGDVGGGSADPEGADVGDTPAGTPYAAWLARHRIGADPARDLRAGDPGSAFLVGFTSGTSGPPKAFHRSRRSWRESLSRAAEVFGTGPGDRVLAPGPLSHGLGLYALAEALHEGAEFTTLPRFDAADAHAVIAARGITRLVVVPTMLRALSRDGEDTPGEDTLGEDGARCAEAGPTARRAEAGPAARDGARPAHTGVTAVVSSGAKLDPATFLRARRVFPGAHVYEYYGASELSFITVRHTPPHAEPDERPGVVGLPFPGVELRIGPQDGTAPGIPTGPGTPGTVWVRGPLTSGGYLWGDDGRAFRTEGPWATVGDLGWLDEQGELHIAGRSGGMVITGGYNVYPAEVEAVLRGVDGVEETQVLGVPDDYLGSVLVAVVSGPAAGSLTHDDVVRECGRALPRYKIPRRVYMVGKWPMTRSGKISRVTLEEWIHHGDGRLVRLPAPPEPTGRPLAPFP
ncbi:acyl-CoA synthetase (AMP-forming)/AMP-acid ligase II [Streptosporangium becharense]|uniref:Acyl-CoA synthetase (AMP-forming)/AMP-acid ligase II n=1 Tax=Streptosporangium becharense TaxID=1816182 RepID=A0A7W9IB36_9ACTN|nr:AMP-binding protein [Streptosporangium becharense]MBB2910718.1 acyl-CoA synthetase (AMP-forming)/AMP-acid ligase II [Streptosporangium becharense]MBB5817413.1 acyl-CoA synthetase (AMP-forming)/AMP-acid ligase II [Streptosporangium becharense]